MKTALAFYRKYRPADFANLTGQDHIKTTLLNALKTQQVAHAYLLCGPRGTGKTSTARLIAKGLNCLNLKETGEPCNACAMCVAIQENRLMDLIEIDAASNRGIDEMRDLRDKIKFSPAQAKKKVFIIDEVHMLTKEAFNALLKTLEEPPAHAHLILATTERHKVPATIISRCQYFDFRRLSPAVMVARLDKVAVLEGIKTDKEALQIIAQAADGSMRDALGLLEQLTFDKKLTLQNVRTNLGLVDHQIIGDFLQLLEGHRVAEAIDFINDKYTKGLDLLQFTRELKEIVRQRMLAAVRLDQKEQIVFWAKTLENLEKVSRELKITPIPQLPLELFLIEAGNQSPQSVAEVNKEAVQNITQPVILSAQKPPTAQKTPAPVPTQKDTTPVQNMQGLDLNMIRENWKQVLTLLKIPSLKLALGKAVLQNFTQDLLEIGFPSQFELEKVTNVKAQNELETAIKTIIKTPIKVKGVLLKKSTNSNDHSEVMASLDQIVDLFHGEIVDK